MWMHAAGWAVAWLFSGAAFADVDPACQGLPKPDDYNEQAQQDFQANYFALASTFSPVHGPVPHEPGHGSIGVDVRVMPALPCERRFVLDWTKTEQTNKSPLIPTLAASYAFPAIKEIIVPYAAFSILPPIPLGDPDNPKSDTKLPVCDGKTPLTECRRTTRNLVMSGEIGVGFDALEHFQAGVRGHATVMRTYGDIATAFDEETEPSVEDVYAASSWGFDAQVGVPVGVGKQAFTPYIAAGYLNTSTFFFIGDDQIAGNNLHPYSGPAFSAGLDSLLQERVRIGAEFYAAPGGSSLPDPTAERVDGFGRYGHLYTARLRLGVEL
jgi:hypothetical protein